MSGVLTYITPSAAPSDADIDAWNSLPRDEQLARLRAALNHPDSSAASDETMAELLAEARRRAGERRRG